MAGYIGSRAVSVNTTSATITDDLTIGDDLTVTDDMTVGGTLGVTGVLTATSLDISGDIDVDGTTNLDAVDIDGAVNMATTALVTGVLTTTAATVFNGGFASNAASTISTADNNPQITLVSTSTNASQGPVLDLFRNSSSPADNDLGGAIKFNAENDAGEKTQYQIIQAYMPDVSNGSEDGAFQHYVMKDGTSIQRLEHSPTETVFNQDHADINFRVESDTKTHAFFVEGDNTSNRLKIGMGTGTISNPYSQDNFTDLNIDGVWGGVISFKVGGTEKGWTGQRASGNGGMTLGASSGQELHLFSNDVLAQHIDASGNIIIANTGGTLITTTAGTSNVRFGVNAGNSILDTGNYNTVVGDEAGTAISTGDNNVAVGYQALAAEDEHGGNVAVGGSSLANLNAGLDAFNTAVGFLAGNSLTTGHYNVAIGTGALDNEQAGRQNVAIGYNALGTQREDSDNRNTAVGYQAGSALSTAIQTTLLGHSAGGTGTITGDNNTALGYAAGNNLTSGSECTFVGTLAGDAVDTSGSNTAVGFAALSADCGTENTVMGSESAKTVTGSSNVFIGASAGVQSTGCDSSVVIGKSACSAANMTGNNNTVMGVSAGLSITSGAGNVIIGKSAGTTTTALSTGASNIIIGLNARTNAVNTNNAIVMGENVSGQANNNFSFGVGTTDSNIVFGEDSITTPSDERYKEDITTSTAGLAFIKDLRPVTFKWKKEKDVPTNSESYVEGSDTRVMLSNGETNHGFIAQEVKTVMDNHPEIKDGFRMWAESDRADKRQRLGSTALIPILVKAIQELSAKNDALEARIVTLEG